MKDQSEAGAQRQKSQDKEFNCALPILQFLVNLFLNLIYAKDGGA